MTTKTKTSPFSTEEIIEKIKQEIKYDKEINIECSKIPDFKEISGIKQMDKVMGIIRDKSIQKALYLKDVEVKKMIEENSFFIDKIILANKLSLDKLECEITGKVVFVEELLSKLGVGEK